MLRQSAKWGKVWKNATDWVLLMSFGVGARSTTGAVLARSVQIVQTHRLEVERIPSKPPIWLSQRRGRPRVLPTSDAGAATYFSQSTVLCSVRSSASSYTQPHPYFYSCPFLPPGFQHLPFFLTYFAPLITPPAFSLSFTHSLFACLA